MSGDTSPLETNRIINGDSFDVLEELPADSVHAIVSDPPYGLNFMGRSWDDFEPREYQQWCEEWSTKAKRVLKPGGHLLAFSGSRTHHRLFSGVEDAGYELRDCITWHYGGGFPKAHDVSKALDKRAGEEREMGAVKTTPDGKEWTDRIPERDGYRDREATYSDSKHDIRESIPATDEAEQWEGFKTALKPATEFVTLARKPFDGTVAENVLEHGTAALNIGECRIESDGRPGREADPKKTENNTYEGRMDGSLPGGSKATGTTDEGRFPSNVVFDEDAAAALDDEVGELDAGAHTPQGAKADSVRCYGDKRYRDAPDERYETDSGGPSRYFYTSKASTAERTLDGKIENAHPTQKPLDLMEWLVKLSTAEGQIVLDPFAGTGSTLRAAKNVGREFVGIEQQAKWADVARARCGLDVEDPSILSDEQQNHLGAYADGGQE